MCDNATSNDTMIDTLPSILYGYPGEASQVWCFCHVLNLVVKSVLVQFDVLKTKKKKTVKKRKYISKAKKKGRKKAAKAEPVDADDEWEDVVDPEEEEIYDTFREVTGSRYVLGIRTYIHFLSRI